MQIIQNLVDFHRTGERGANSIFSEGKGLISALEEHSFRVTSEVRLRHFGRMGQSFPHIRSPCSNVDFYPSN